MIFKVSDNGSGFDGLKKKDSHKSLAMNITQERLINYTKNQDFKILADNRKDQHGSVVGAEVTFEIPYIYEN